MPMSETSAKNPFYEHFDRMTDIGEPITDDTGRKIQLYRHGNVTIIGTDECVFNGISDDVLDRHAEELGERRDVAVLRAVARYARGESLTEIIDFSADPEKI